MRSYYCGVKGIALCVMQSTEDTPVTVGGAGAGLGQQTASTEAVKGPDKMGGSPCQKKLQSERTVAAVNHLRHMEACRVTDC